MDPAAEGTVYPDASFTLDTARVHAFRALFGAAGGVPLTFLTAAEFDIYPQIMHDPAVDLEFTRVLHATQEYEYARPLLEGETLTASARIESIRSKGETEFLTILTTFTDAAGAVVATARSTMVERGPGA